MQWNCRIVNHGELHRLGISARPGIRSTVSLTTLKERRSSRLALSWEKILLETLEELVTVGAWKDATLWLGSDGQDSLARPARTAGRTGSH
ncbi:hypothetical protein VC36_25470 [Pseudomonas marginalis]|nr:hypothetical protein VC37_17800 [Pseudomonas marginalis]KJZ54264.1 hypothetical protein VC36_25470 [Pseudomonas marginalis]